jgi:hypothetical protein
MSEKHPSDLFDQGQTPAGLRWALVVSTAVAVVVVAAVAGQPIITDDFWWHLKLGELVLENRAFPATDPFLFESVAGAPFLHEWLFEVMIAGFERLFGLASLRLFHLVLALLALVAVYRFSRRMGLAPAIALAVVLVFFVFGYSRLVQLRPQLLSMPLFFWFLGMIYVHRSDLTKGTIALLAVATAFWANLHSIFVITFPFWAALVLAYWLVGANRPDTGGISVRAHLAGIAVCLAAALFNPRGWGVFIFYFQHNQVNPAQDIIDDFARFIPWREAAFLPLSSPVLRILFVLLALAVLVGVIRVLLDWRFRRPVDSAGRNRLAVRLYFAVAAVMSIAAMVLAVRFTWLAPVAVLLVVHEAAVANSINVRIGRWAGLMLCAVTLTFAFQPGARSYAFFLHGQPQVWANYWESAYDERKFRKNAADFLEHLDIGGNLYNPYYLGGYLAWRLSPRYKTFLDGRHDRYPAQLYADSQTLQAGNTGQLRIIERYPFDAFLVPVDRTSIRLRLGLVELGWAKVFNDRHTVVYVRPAVFESDTALDSLRSWHVPLDLGSAFGADEFTITLDAWIVDRGFAPLPGPGEAPMSRQAWQAEFFRAIEHLLIDHVENLADYARSTWTPAPRVLENLDALATVREQLRKERVEIFNRGVESPESLP